MEPFLHLPGVVASFLSTDNTEGHPQDCIWGALSPTGSACLPPALAQLPVIGTQAHQSACVIADLSGESWRPIQARCMSHS